MSREDRIREMVKQGDERRQRLLEMILEVSFDLREITLSSGARRATSTWTCRQTADAHRWARSSRASWCSAT